MHRLFINLGKKDGFFPAEVMQFLNKHVSGHVEVGHIDLGPTISFFDVPEEDAKRVAKALNGTRYKGREVRCNDGEQDSSTRGRKTKREGAPGIQKYTRGKQKYSQGSASEGGKADEMGKKGRKSREVKTNDHTFDYSFFDKKSKRENPRKQRGEVRKESMRKDDWRQLIGDVPDFTEEGWALRIPRKKK